MNKKVLDLEEEVWRHLREYEEANPSIKDGIATYRFPRLLAQTKNPTARARLQTIIDKHQKHALLRLAASLQQRADEPIEEGSARLLDEDRDSTIEVVSAVLVFYVLRGRNAWHSTWVEHYFADCMHTSFLSAKRNAESRRGPGNVFRVIEKPALRIDLPHRSHVITEIDCADPLAEFWRESDFEDELAPGHSFSGFVDTLLPYLRQGRGRRIVALHIPRSRRLELLDDVISLKIHSSFSRGSQYQLGWSSESVSSRCGESVRALAG